MKCHITLSDCGVGTALQVLVGLMAETGSAMPISTKGVDTIACDREEVLHPSECGAFAVWGEWWVQGCSGWWSRSTAKQHR